MPRGREYCVEGVCTGYGSYAVEEGSTALRRRVRKSLPGAS